MTRFVALNNTGSAKSRETHAGITWDSANTWDAST